MTGIDPLLYLTGLVLQKLIEQYEYEAAEIVEVEETNAEFDILARDAVWIASRTLNEINKRKK